jgi:hypothetical protein
MSEAKRPVLPVGGYQYGVFRNQPRRNSIPGNTAVPQKPVIKRIDDELLSLEVISWKVHISY